MSAHTVPITPTQVRGACPHDCPDTCALLTTVENGRAVRVQGNPAHAQTGGVLCAKVSKYPERTYHAERILTPLKRSGPKGSGQFTPVGWDEALADIAARLEAIAARDPQAIQPYSYAGTMGLVQGESMDRRFFHRLGASFLDRTICATAGGEGLVHTLGGKVGMKVEFFAESKLILIWGSNSIGSNLHFWRIAQQAKRGGAKLVCIDPRKSETAEKCHEHIQLLPGTDAALALALMHELIAHGWLDHDYIARHTVGWEKLRERALQWPPERAAQACGLQALVWTGATPPVDATLELTTVTPDPAVIEINSAPSRNCAEFFWRSQQAYAAAAAHGLSPYRLYFNGQVADSGGAGQITFGGPTPEASPFVTHLPLLPRLVRYFNRHPALSYRFAHDFVGGSGQSVRADERGTDAFDDLVLALALLERQPVTEPELLWKSLASFLCDAVGNSHRAEINIEKLWNPYLPGRGRLGLVEFRGLRMQHTPQRATAIACLLRAVIAMLATRPYALPLIDWGRELHDRFALPFYLQADLDTVLAELDAAGLGLETPIQAVLRHDAFRFLGQVDLPFGTLELWRGLEFWPLVGDAASPEQSGSSRFVDASTTRIEIRWRPTTTDAAGTQDAGPWQDWAITVDGVTLPLRPERDSRGDLKVFGVRYASFAPRSGLHPVLGSQAPLTLTLGHADHDVQHDITLHEWRPDGEAYPGLPVDLMEAGERRAARMTVVERELAEQTLPDESGTEASPGLTAYSLDRRYR